MFTLHNGSQVTKLGLRLIMLWHFWLHGEGVRTADLQECCHFPSNASAGRSQPMLWRITTTPKPWCVPEFLSKRGGGPNLIQRPHVAFKAIQASLSVIRK
jgi:hypothetical protein